LEREQIHAGPCESSLVGRLYQDREILAPVLVEIQVDPSAYVCRVQHCALDDLIRAPEAQQIPMAIRWPDLIRRMAPETQPGLSRLRLGRNEVFRARGAPCQPVGPGLAPP